MGVRIFLSSNSGNKEIENSQQRIQMVLTTRHIQFDTIDISIPGMQDMRSFMREKGRRREGQRNVLPPQIFNGEEYRGDYEGFDIANEDDDLEEFLGIPRKNPKFEPVKTGAVAPEVGRMNPGKLKKDEKLEIDEISKEDQKTEENNINNVDVSNINNEKDNMGNSCMGNQEQLGQNGDQQNNTEADEEENEDDSSEEEDKQADSLDIEGINGDNFKDWKHSVEEGAQKNEAEKVLEKTDGLMGHLKQEVNMDNDGLFDALQCGDDSEDSSDESTDEDTAVEYMPDGELVRKKSRGFKQLTNCRRFWKASIDCE